MIIKVKVKPGTSKNEVKKLDDNLYEIRTTAQPEKGKANEKVIILLAEFFKVPKSSVEIIRGQTSKEKDVRINL